MSAAVASSRFASRALTTTSQPAWANHGRGRGSMRGRWPCAELSGSFRQNALSSRPRVRFAKMPAPRQSPTVIARQRVRPSAGPMTGSRGRSSNRQRCYGYWMPRIRGHDGLQVVIETNSIVPGERAPGRCLGCPPGPGGRSADRRWCGTPHPVARLAAKPVPSAEGNSRPITRAGAPIGASPRRFSLVLGTAFWRRTGAPIRTPLIPRGFPRFHPLHQPVAGRTHVVGPGDVSRGPRRPG